MIQHLASKFNIGKLSPTEVGGRDGSIPRMRFPLSTWKSEPRLYNFRPCLGEEAHQMSKVNDGEAGADLVGVEKGTQQSFWRASYVFLSLIHI